MKTELNNSKKAGRLCAGKVVKVKLEATSSKFTSTATTTPGVSVKDVEAEGHKGVNIKKEVEIKEEGADCTKVTSASISKVKLEETSAPPTLLTTGVTLFTGKCNCGVKCSWEKDLPVFKKVIKGMIEICTNDPVRTLPTPSEIRHQVYRRYAKIHHPYLQKRQRIMIPDCVLYKIHNEWPNPDGVGYVGHRDYE